MVLWEVTCLSGVTSPSDGSHQSVFQSSRAITAGTKSKNDVRMGCPTLIPRDLILPWPVRAFFARGASMLLPLLLCSLAHASFWCVGAESDFAVAASLSLIITLGLDCVQAWRTVAIRL